jgi:type IX secretion system PorP/SprF family membrane protein
MKTRYYFTVICLLMIGVSRAQDQSLLNANQSLLQTNPSFAGSNGSIRDQFVYRSLWPSMAGANRTYYNGFDAYVKKLHGGVALSGKMTDVGMGLFQYSDLNVIYAPTFECKESGIKVIPSIQLSYLQNAVDYSRLSFGPGSILWNASGEIPRSKREAFDAGAGLLVNYKNLYVGGSVFHVNQPDIGLFGPGKLPSRLNLNTSYTIPLNEKTLINFSAVYSRQQKYNELQFAVNALFFKYLVAGLGVQTTDAVFANLGYRNNFMSVTLGYDIEYDRLSPYRSGSWQIAAAFSLRKKEKGQLPSSFEKW